MYKQVVLPVFVLLLWACNSQEGRKPDRLLNPDQMAALIVDLQMADAWVAIKRSEGDAPSDMQWKLYDSVFSIHEVNRQIFEQNIQWYATRLAEMDQIYDDVIQRLNLIQADTTLRESGSAKSGL